MPVRPSERYVRLAAALPGLGLLLLGCASPGPPRPPSLRLPGPVKGLAASRQGDVVTVRFTMPLRTTDGQAIRETTLVPVLCRAEAGMPCVALSPGKPVAVKNVQGAPNVVTLEDTLPTIASTGSLRPLEYRVELLNDHGRTEGFSSPAWIAAGGAPSPVAGFRVEPTRLGSLLAWSPATGEQGRVLIRRTKIATDPKAPDSTLLRAESLGNADVDTTKMLDNTALEGVGYRYVAYRERMVKLGDRTLVLDSADSAPVEFTLVDRFPPPAPTELYAAPFTTEATAKQASVFAVDLIWKPVDDPGLAGYNIYRTDAAGTHVKLNQEPATTPSFHDATVRADGRYTYSVTAVDRRGNESTAATVSVAP